MRATVPRDTVAAERLGSRFGMLMACLLLSSLGIGLVFPLTTLYIDHVLGLGPTAAGRYFVAMAVASCAAAVAGGRRVDSSGAIGVGSLGCGALVVGYAVLGVANAGVWVVVSGACAGVGFGLQYSAIGEAVTGLVAEALHRRAFTIRHGMTNIGMGLGAALSALLLSVRSHEGDTLRMLYPCAAAASVPLTIAFRLLAPTARTGVRSGGPSAVRYQDLLRDPRLALLLVGQMLLAGAGFTQLESSVPQLLNHRMAIGLSGVAALIACNAFALLVLQGPVGRLCERIPEALALTAAPALWCVAFGLGAAASAGGGVGRTVVLTGFATVFAIGEICYSSAFFPLLVRFAGPLALGRAGALSSLAWSAGTAAGPPLGLALVAGHGLVACWLVLSAASVAVASVPLITHVVVRRLEGARPTL